MRDRIEVDITLPGDTSYLRMICDMGAITAQEVNCPEEAGKILSDQIETVLAEGVVNAIRHAGRTGVKGKIRIRIKITDGELVIRIYDSGVGFDIATIPPPDFDSNRMEERGRGIFILKSLMDTVEYLRCESGNVLEMRKKIPY